MVDERDVEDAEPVLAAGGVEVLAARLDVEDLGLASGAEAARRCRCRDARGRGRGAAVLDVLGKSSGKASRWSELPMTAWGSSRSVTTTAARPCSPAATQQKRPMKLA